ncbi:MAG: efflux RND transporter periplasmic adaptor subunit [Patescibacteria group bacterium]
MRNLLDKLLLRETYGQIKVWVLAHKLISTTLGMVILGLLVWGGWAIKAQAGPTSYILATVQKGTIMSTVTGTGQVSASHQIDLTPQASGKVTAVKVKSGQSVKAGTLLVQLDSSDAYKTVRDARASLASAQLSLKKTQNSITQSVVQAEDSLTQAQQNQIQSRASLAKSYDDSLATIDTAVLNLSTIVDTLEDVIFGQDYSPTQSNADYYFDILQRCKGYDGLADSYRNSTTSAYYTAKTAYDDISSRYNSVINTSDDDVISQLVSDTYTSVKTILETLKTTNNYLNYVNSQATNYNQIIPASLGSHRNTIASATTQANSYLNSLYSSKTSIQNNLNAVNNAATSVSMKTNSLEQAKTINADLDLATAQLNVTQRSNALNDALQALADYSVKAPFDGVIAKVNVQVADSASGGTVVATIITKQSLVEIPLNEVDVAKVSLGDKATIAFDAIEDLSISGSVASIDYIGTVEQGVVNYTVTLSFDTQDDQIKPGMSASATIITDLKQDVLIIPSSAVKSQGEMYYVDKFNQIYSDTEAAAGITSDAAPTQQTVEVGITDDTNTEIISGLSEGDQIIIKTVKATSSSKKATTTSNSLLGGSGGSRPQSSGGTMMGPMP